MKQKTKAQINRIARLMFIECSNDKKRAKSLAKDMDMELFHSGVWFNMALIAYIEIKQEYGLLRYKI